MGVQVNRTLLGLAGEFGVASQLCLRGYVANLTLKNFPQVDIFAYDTKSGKTVALQVKTALEKKGSKEKYPFMVSEGSREQLDNVLQKKIKQPYVFVYISADRKNTRYFVVPLEDTKKLLKDAFMEWWYHSKHRKSLEELAKSKQPLVLSLDQLEPYEDKWDLLRESVNDRS